jgi:ectoine hydroxylase-related dioxygenase (phytanoyl-CoA dioxygenase family)
MLTDDQKKAFAEYGYLIFERFFDNAECEAYKADIDALMEKRKQGGATTYPCEFPHLGALISDPRIMDIIEDIMGPDFLFHHLHAVRQDAGTGPANWHQDYEQIPQTNRTHIMVHFFYYFNGLNGTIGDLLFIPRTQNTVVNNGALGFLKTETLPGTVVVDNLPPGSAVLVHSALWHARRAQPGGEDHPRYFADASYCQAGIRWPSYGIAAWRELLLKMRDLGIERDGKYAHLFTESAFYDAREAHRLVRSLPGGLVHHLKEWEEK